eukprot:12866592-Heterocapsa_arctica.AAC.1
MDIYVNILQPHECKCERLELSIGRPERKTWKCGQDALPPGVLSAPRRKHHGRVTTWSRLVLVGLSFAEQRRHQQ